jgi:hypothetical protein
VHRMGESESVVEDSVEASEMVTWFGRGDGLNAVAASGVGW